MNAAKQHGCLRKNTLGADAELAELVVDQAFLDGRSEPCNLVSMFDENLIHLDNLVARPRRQPIADLLGYTPNRQSCADGLLAGHTPNRRKSCVDAYLGLVAEENRKRAAQLENPLPVHGFCRLSRDWLSAMGVTEIPRQRFLYERMGPITPSTPRAAPPTKPWIHAALELIEG